MINKMLGISPIKNIFRNGKRYKRLFILFLLLITCVIIALNMMTVSNTYIDRVIEKGEDIAFIDSASNTNIISFMLLIIVLIIIIITTIITSVMYLLNRKYEFAVLRSIGMSNTKIIVSYIVETMVFVSFTSLVAIITGQLIFLYGSLPESMKSSFESLIDTSLPIREILVFNSLSVIFGMIVLVGITVIISMIYILSFEPLKIFNKYYS